MDHMHKMNKAPAHDGDTAMGRIREAADAALETGRETLEELRDQGQDAVDRAQKSAQKAWDDTELYAQKYPAKAVGLALLAGFVIGGALVAMRRNK